MSEQNKAVLRHPFGEVRSQGKLALVDVGMVLRRATMSLYYKVLYEEAYDKSALPGPLKNIDPCFYRLRRA